MTTPATMNRILEDLRERFAEAKQEAVESSLAAMNSYGAGYDSGYAAALAEVIESITGDAP